MPRFSPLLICNYCLFFIPEQATEHTLCYINYTSTLVTESASRYTVEQCIEEAKGETGLDEYEVRFWHSWYRHITLSMMAHAWLASIRRREQEKKAPQPMSFPG